MLKYLVAREQEAEAKVANLESLESNASRAQGRGVAGLSLWDDDPADASYFDYTLGAPIPSASPIVARTTTSLPTEVVAPCVDVAPEPSPSKDQLPRRRLVVESEHERYVTASAGPGPKELGKVDLVKLWDVSAFLEKFI